MHLFGCLYTPPIYTISYFSWHVSCVLFTSPLLHLFDVYCASVTCSLHYPNTPPLRSLLGTCHAVSTLLQYSTSKKSTGQVSGGLYTTPIIKFLEVEWARGRGCVHYYKNKQLRSRGGRRQGVCTLVQKSTAERSSGQDERGAETNRRTR